METINLAAETDDARGKSVQADRSTRSGLRQTCIEKMENQTIESSEDAIRIAPVLIKATVRQRMFLQ